MYVNHDCDIKLTLIKQLNDINFCIVRKLWSSYPWKKNHGNKTSNKYDIQSKDIY